MIRTKKILFLLGILYFSSLFIINTNSVYAIGLKKAKVEVKSNIYGKGFVNGYSTLKTENNGAIKYKERSKAKIKVILPRHQKVDDKKIDSSKAKVSLISGDGYYVNNLKLRANKLENKWKNGQTSYLLKTNDLTWTNNGYHVDNGGQEWSGIGGDGSGNYYFNLKLSNIKYNHKVLPEATFRIHIYIYGRDFGGSGKYGTPGYDDVVWPSLIYQKFKTLKNDTSKPIFKWKGEGSKPILCDYKTDNFMIYWPIKLNKAKIFKKDVKVKLYSQYNDTLTIPKKYIGIKNSGKTTQIAIDYVYWPFTPVYTKMKIIVKKERKTYSKIYNIASVYTHMVQTGGGLDRDRTVIAYEFYGIKNLISWKQVVSEPSYMFAYKPANASPHDPYKYFYAEDKNGKGYIELNERKAKIFYDKNNESNIQLLGNTVYVTEKIAKAKKIQYQGKTYKLEKTLVGGKPVVPSKDLKPSKGYIMTKSQFWDTHQRWAWLNFNNKGWISEKNKGEIYQ